MSDWGGARVDTRQTHVMITLSTKSSLDDASLANTTLSSVDKGRSLKPRRTMASTAAPGIGTAEGGGNAEETTIGGVEETIELGARQDGGLRMHATQKKLVLGVCF